MVQSLLAVGATKTIASSIVVKGVLDLTPLESLITAVLREHQLIRTPKAIVSLLPDNYNTLPVTATISSFCLFKKGCLENQLNILRVSEHVLRVEAE